MQLRAKFDGEYSESLVEYYAYTGHRSTHEQQLPMTARSCLVNGRPNARIRPIDRLSGIAPILSLNSLWIRRSALHSTKTVNSVVERKR